MDKNPVDDAAVAGGEVVGIPTLAQSARALAGVLAPSPAVAAEVRQLPGGLVRILSGKSEIEPKSDRRFADPAWTENPLFRRLAQAYLAGGSAVTRLVDEKEASGMEARALERARFASALAIAAVSPANLLLTNPTGLKRAFDTAGASVARGAGNFIHDLRHNGGFPSTVDQAPFQVGRDLAVSPGSVVASR